MDDKEILRSLIGEIYQPEELYAIDDSIIQFLKSCQNSYNERGKMIALALLMEAHALDIIKHTMEELVEKEEP